MKNNEKLVSAFSTALGIDSSLVNETLNYHEIPEWDSTAHMILVAEIENVFDIMLDTDDIIDMSSFASAKSILTNYDIPF